MNALEIFRDFNDGHSITITLFNLYNLWREEGDDGLFVKIGEIMGAPETEVRELFEKWSSENAGEDGNAD